MVRYTYCSKEGLNCGAWTKKEDMILSEYISIHGDGRWRNLPPKAGLRRSGKSCRIRWMHYLRPDIKRGNISDDEEELIIRMHRLLGNWWSLIAGRLPGRMANEVKNHWNTHLKKRLFMDEPDRCNNIDALKFCQIQETRNSSKTCCELFVNDSISEDYSERNIASRIMADASNLAETEAGQQCLDSYHFAGNAAATVLEELLFDSNKQSSPDCKESYFSTGFELEDIFYSSGPSTLDAETNEVEHQSNMQQVKISITVPDDQRKKEFYDSTELVDWNRVLSYTVD